MVPFAYAQEATPDWLITIASGDLSKGKNHFMEKKCSLHLEIRS